MRATWIVMGLVVGVGAFAYARIKAKAGTPALSRAVAQEPASGKTTPPPPPAGGMADAHQVPAPSATPASPRAQAADEAEARAQVVVQALRARLDAKDEAGAASVERELDGPLQETAAARRHALERGFSALRASEGKPPAESVALLDRARRDMTRGLFLDEMFDPATGRPTEDRRHVVEAIAGANTRVMTFPGGVEGVTKPQVVKGGDSPVGIVTRERLPYGHDALLFWNHGGNLDPTRLRSGETLMVPVEPVTVRVSLARRLLGVYVGPVLAREFEVGVGSAATPTPVGDYAVGDKQLNPDWHPPGGKVVKYGDPANELGDAWIAIGSPQHPTGYGIHGTNKPETVGTDCSRGCVRLKNAEALEVYWWVRTARSGGSATRVEIR